MRTKQTNKGLYLKQVFSKEDQILKNIREWSEKEKVASMQISAYEGGILQFLCRARKVKKAVEIGTLYGYSALMIARALPEDGQLFSLDINQKSQQKARELIKEDPSAKKIHFLAGPALNSLKNLEDKAPFDMIFIDADKAAYLEYLKWSNIHLKSGGLLMADNTFLFGAVYGEAEERSHPSAEETTKIMRAFNNEVAHSGLYHATLIPTAEGLTLGIKK